MLVLFVYVTIKGDAMSEPIPNIPENFSDLSPQAYQDTVDLILFDMLGSDDAASSSQGDLDPDEPLS
jgi:hypothetical protein